MEKIEKLQAFFSSKKKKSVEDYQKIICEFGLVNDSAPNLYGDDRVFMSQDRSDLAIYQTPIQFAKLLKFLEPYKFNSYLEIGLFAGGTFLFMKYFLEAKNPKILLNCIDPNNYVHAAAKGIVGPHKLPGTSKDLSKEYDLVFIDGDHSYTWVEEDYHNAGQFAKVCIIHDIDEPSCPDVKRYWQKLLKDKEENKDFPFENHIEFTETVSERKIVHQGIGILY